MKIKKCKFNVNTTNFLGFVITPDGIKMDESKVQVIQDWLMPWKVKDVQSFLGFTNFYHQFIANYLDMSIPLNQLTHKGVKWNWSPTCQEVFKLLKDAFLSAPVLHHFDPSFPPIVKTNTSNYTITGIFSLQADNSDIHPIAFYSCTLHGAELNYDTHNKELLAIFKAFKMW